MCSLREEGCSYFLFYIGEIYCLKMCVHVSNKKSITSFVHARTDTAHACMSLMELQACMDVVNIVMVCHVDSLDEVKFKAFLVGGFVCLCAVMGVGAANLWGIPGKVRVHHHCMPLRVMSAHGCQHVH